MTKLLSMRDALERFVPDGSSVLMGAALESLIPFAAGHEIIRQGRRELTLVGPISDMLFDQLIGAGCVERVVAAWVGNVSAGLGHNYRRAAEHGQPCPIEVEDHSNFSVSLALLAAAWGVPYLPTRSLLGSGLLETNPGFKAERSPFGGEILALVPALKPDVAILQVQRSDEDGHVHCWGNLGISEAAALAAATVIAVAEEIVPSQVVKSDPNRILVPPARVAAVVHEPGGAHPSPVQGYYNRDHAFYHEYHRASREADGFREWLKRWVLELPDRQAYLERLGSERWLALKPKEQRLAAPVDYGY
jgi:glutaconate CoA-transferase, subunit A